MVEYPLHEKKVNMRRMLRMPEVGALLVLASLLHRVALRARLHNSKISVKRTDTSEPVIAENVTTHQQYSIVQDQ
jgi:hypothetical protein